MKEGLIYDIMVDVNKRPEGWNKELYDKLSYDFRIECAKNGEIEEWNQVYEAYLRSEWERVFPLIECDKKSKMVLFDDIFSFVRPDFHSKYFIDTILDGFNLSGAHLNEANFSRAHLDGAEFFSAHLEGAKFILSIVNEETFFAENTLDKKTDFTGTSLSAARIDPELRTQLERNIRKIHWEAWYKMPKLYPALEKIKNTLIIKFSARKSPEKKKWETKLCCVDRVINAFVRTFWWMSNYGSSTKRIIAVFFGWNILWEFIYYYLLPFLPGINTTVLNVSNIWAAILQTNLMMFSITDLATEGLDILPMLFVTIHIVVGYFILSALITRLGIMFQNLSP